MLILADEHPKVFFLFFESSRVMKINKHCNKKFEHFSPFI